MTLTFVVLLLSTVELVLFIPVIWKLRRVLAAIMLICLALLFGWLLSNQWSWTALALVVVGAYRGINLLRIVQNRMHQRYLHQVTLRTSVSLLGISFGVLAVGSLVSAATAHRSLILVLIATVDLLLVSVLVATIWRSQRRTAVALPQLHSANNDLPSISVCIPARNETETLEACLRSLIATNYPKLEILVLDDESHDRTPDIIRGFAHDGVRFIKGNQPPTNWLAKNWAYKRLAEEANSDLIVFTGVDIRFEADSLRQMILTMNIRKLDMMSCIPLNCAQQIHGRQTTLIQPIRYAWEFVVSQLPHGRPSVLSSCWVVRRSLLVKAGGFKAVQRAVLPEIHFARCAASRYLFIQGGPLFAVTSDKPNASQLATAIRTRYPQVHRRPEAVLLLSSFQGIVLLLPYVQLISAVANHQWLIVLGSLLTIAVLHDSYLSLTKLTYGTTLKRGILVFPIAVMADIGIRHISMWRYEFGKVVWKERDVTAPIMHVEPHLPKLAP